MELISLIETNVGYPILIFYAAATVLLTFAFTQKLGVILAFIYGVSLCSAVSCVWEVPLFFSANAFGDSFLVGFMYLAPLIMFKLAFKPKYNFSGIAGDAVLFILIPFAYAFSAPMNIPDFWINLGNYSSFQYLTTFIPRTAALIGLADLLNPVGVRSV